MNLFSQNSVLLPSDIKVPEMPMIYKTSHQNDEEIQKREKEVLMRQLERFDDNVKHAILLRTEKDNKSEFYRKLETLTERIHIYKNIFYTKHPVFAQKTDKPKKKKSKKNN